MDTTKYALIGSASGWGAQIRSTEEGPDFLKGYGLNNLILDDRCSLMWDEVLYPNVRSADSDLPCGPEVLEVLVPHLNKLAEKIQGVLERGDFPIAIGGDHAMAIGTVAGCVNALHAHENFGMIWIDAHMDSHTPQSSPSYAYHGMPLAVLMGYGEQELLAVGGPQIKLNPAHVVLIGVRSYEDGEAQLLHDLGVRVISSQEVFDRGFKAVAQECLQRFEAQGINNFGISLDLDVFDPLYAPGVGSPEEKGLVPTEVLPHLKVFRDHPAFRFLEITEFNPTLDRDNITADLIINVLKNMIPRGATTNGLTKAV